MKTDRFCDTMSRIDRFLQCLNIDVDCYISDQISERFLPSFLPRKLAAGGTHLSNKSTIHCGISRLIQIPLSTPVLGHWSLEIPLAFYLYIF